MRENHEIPDPEQIKKILNVVSEKVPELLERMSDILYGKDKAKKYGLAVATFYKELKAAGMTDEQAYELTREYMSALSLGNMMSKFGHRGHNHEHGFNPIAQEIKEHVRDSIKDEFARKKRKK